MAQRKHHALFFLFLYISNIEAGSAAQATESVDGPDEHSIFLGGGLWTLTR
jgi:hypothetical protein